MKKLNFSFKVLIIDYILISLILIIIIYIILFNNGLIKFDNKPEFKITKEECLNESYWHMYDNFIQVSWNVSWLLTANEKVECSELTCHIFFKDYKEVCETKEVDEIEYGYSNSCVSHSPNEEWMEENCRLIISKKDLSIEWLNDNCECSMLIDDEEYRGYCKQQNYTFQECVHIAATLIIYDENCDKYKCGKYKVEVR